MRGYLGFGELIFLSFLLLVVVFPYDGPYPLKKKKKGFSFDKEVMVSIKTMQ